MNRKALLIIGTLLIILVVIALFYFLFSRTDSVKEAEVKNNTPVVNLADPNSTDNVSQDLNQEQLVEIVETEPNFVFTEDFEVEQQKQIELLEKQAQGLSQ